MGLPRPAGIPSSAGASRGLAVGSLKHRIRNFAIKYGHQFNLDRTKVAKPLEEKFSRAV